MLRKSNSRLRFLEKLSLYTVLQVFRLRNIANTIGKTGAKFYTNFQNMFLSLNFLILFESLRSRDWDGIRIENFSYSHV
jgi:hypothetical protein